MNLGSVGGMLPDMKLVSLFFKFSMNCLEVFQLSCFVVCNNIDTFDM